MPSRKISAGKNKNGSLMIELAVALAVGSIALTAISSLIIVRQDYVFNLSQKRQALFLAAADIEKVRASAEKGFLPTEETNLIENINPCLENIVSEAGWNSFGVNRKISFEIMIPDISYAKNIDGDCGGNPLDISDIALRPPAVKNIPVSGLSGSADALKNIVAVGTRIEDASELRIYDISGTEPSLLSSLVMPANINSLDLTQKYAYVASDGPEQQFSVIETNDTRNPKIISSISLPQVAGSFPNATSIFYFDKKIYIGTHRTAGDEFHIFESNFGNPIWLGSLELNHNVNAISVRWPYAYLATSGNSENLIILDVSNPSNPRKISSLAFSGNEDSLSIFLSGNSLYIGRKKSVRPSEPDFIIVDIKNPLRPKILGSLALKTDITGIRVAGKYAFLSTYSIKNPLSVADISNKNNPKTVPFSSFGGKASGIDIENGKILILTSQ